MAKRGKIKSPFLSLPFLSGILVVIIVVAGLSFSLGQQTDVKSISDFRPPKLATESGDASTSANRCQARINSFSVSGVCGTNEKNGFTKFTYSCSNGTYGTIQKGCYSAADLFSQARILCYKSACPVPSVSVKPTRTSLTPSIKPLTGSTNRR